MSGRRLAWVLLPLLLLATFGQVRRAVRAWQANQLLAAVEHDSKLAAATLGEPAAARMRRELVRRNLLRLRIVGEIDRVNVLVPLLAGGQHMLLGDPQAALGAYRRALRIEPRGEVYFNLARALQAAGETAQAEEAQRIALSLDPTLHRRSPPGTGP